VGKILLLGVKLKTGQRWCVARWFCLAVMHLGRDIGYNDGLPNDVSPNNILPKSTESTFRLLMFFLNVGSPKDVLPNDILPNFVRILI
jgi:hypothetical protein